LPEIPQSQEELDLLRAAAQEEVVAAQGSLNQAEGNLKNAPAAAGMVGRVRVGVPQLDMNKLTYEIAISKATLGLRMLNLWFLWAQPWINLRPLFNLLNALGKLQLANAGLAKAQADLNAYKGLQANSPSPLNKTAVQTAFVAERNAAAQQLQAQAAAILASNQFVGAAAQAWDSLNGFLGNL
jgi:hypothetical protein